MEMKSQSFSINRLLELAPSPSDSQGESGESPQDHTKSISLAERLADIILEVHGQNKRKPKRVRTAFTPRQLQVLEHTFANTHYPDVLLREQLATFTSIAETKIQVWFKNRRAKQRKQDRSNWENKSKDQSTGQAGKSVNSKQRLPEELLRNPVPPNAVCPTNANFVASIPVPLNTSVPRMHNTQFRLPAISTFSHPQSSQGGDRYEPYSRPAIPYTPPYQLCPPAPEYVPCLYSNSTLEGLLPGY